MNFRILHAFLLTMMLALPAAAQNPQAPPTNSRDPQFGSRRNQQDADEIRMEKERAKAVNHARQETIKTDTDKLLQLATELKQYVDKSNEHVLSLTVMKKAEEIEKLARTVKEKMKGN